MLVILVVETFDWVVVVGMGIVVEVDEVVEFGRYGIVGERLASSMFVADPVIHSSTNSSSAIPSSMIPESPKKKSNPTNSAMKRKYLRPRNYSTHPDSNYSH